MVFNAAGSHILMGVDMDDISEMISKPSADQEGVTVFKLNELLPIYGSSDYYQAPKIIMIKHENERKGLMIDIPFDIRYVSIDNIHPMPDIFQEKYLNNPIWAIAIMNGEFIFIVNFKKLLTIR